LPLNDEGVTVLHEAQTSENVAEMRLPRDGKWYGLFTWTLAEVLSQTVEPLTHRELIERAAVRYRQYSRNGAQLAVSGASARPVLGRTKPIVRPPLTIVPAWAAEGPLLSAGALHGVTQDSIVALYPPTGAMSDSSIIGYARVSRADPSHARLEPTPFEGRPAPSHELLAVGTRCRFVRHGDR
jgi:hypothetical protein